jgi:hypothetical protein
VCETYADGFGALSLAKGLSPRFTLACLSVLAAFGTARLALTAGAVSRAVTKRARRKRMSRLVIVRKIGGGREWMDGGRGRFFISREDGAAQSRNVTG